MVANNLHSILANQTNVTLARNQRLVASWLPPPSPSEMQQPRLGAEPDEEDGQTFVPELEFLGLGQALPQAIGSAQASDPSSSDAKLRRQLLGRNHDKLKRANGAHAKGSRLPAATKPTVFRTDKRAAHESSSEDEHGRSALGRPALAKKSRSRASSEDEITNDLEGHLGRDGTSKASQQSVTGKAADVSTKHYLDQVLAEKAARKMRKRRKRHVRKEKMQRASEPGGTVATE